MIWIAIIRKYKNFFFLIGVALITLFIGLYIGLQKGSFLPYNQRKVEVHTSHQTLIEQIEALGKMELVRYQIKDVIEHRRGSGYAYLPDAKVLLVVEGEAVGCINLKDINEDRVEMIGDSIYIRLPSPELCYHKVNHEKSKVYDTQFTLLANEAGMVDEAYKKAETQIRDTALKSGIIEQTKQNAKLILKPMLEQMSGKTVFLSFDLETGSLIHQDR
ncbi:MAG: DUF4230 domain-containing protein [Bernardetiaceae bacterium]|nr:DUF4230 domain-containing protein [Bernardetiaceae bacterium]